MKGVRTGNLLLQSNHRLSHGGLLLLEGSQAALKERLLGLGLSEFLLKRCPFLGELHPLLRESERGQRRWRGRRNRGKRRGDLGSGVEVLLEGRLLLNEGGRGRLSTALSLLELLDALLDREEAGLGSVALLGDVGEAGLELGELLLRGESLARVKSRGRGKIRRTFDSKAAFSCWTAARAAEASSSFLRSASRAS